MPADALEVRMTTRSELLEVVYRFYPRGAQPYARIHVPPGEPFYDDTDEYRRLVEASNRGRAEYPTWKAMTRRLEDRYSLQNESIRLLGGLDSACSARIYRPKDLEPVPSFSSRASLSFHVSLLGPYLRSAAGRAAVCGVAPPKGAPPAGGSRPELEFQGNAGRKVTFKRMPPWIPSTAAPSRSSPTTSIVASSGLAPKGSGSCRTASPGPPRWMPRSASMAAAPSSRTPPLASSTSSNHSPRSPTSSRRPARRTRVEAPQAAVEAWQAPEPHASAASRWPDESWIRRLKWRSGKISGCRAPRPRKTQ